ncbi:MAG: hypothetical protein KF900_01180 [Bacteroidetes bacterium]|nr:hypothetical protein [Bacteroidota bacterium]
MKTWKIIFYILGIIPCTFIISLLTFYFHAGLILGYLPSFSHPDPKELSIYKDYSPFVDWTGSMWLFSFIVWLFVTIAYIIKIRIIDRNKIEWTSIIISGIGHFFGILLMFSEINEWYWD